MFKKLCVIVLILNTAIIAGQEGVRIEVDDTGTFTYVDDFSTPRFLQDAFIENVDLSCWSVGAISNAGPNRHRTLTYRFFSDDVIDNVAVAITQRANSRGLGGNNYLYISHNGLDWILADRSSDHPADGEGWHTTDLTVDAEAASVCVGQKECYLRIELDNVSGLETAVSNSISNLEVNITVHEQQGGADSVNADQELFTRLYSQVNGEVLTFDAALEDEFLPDYYLEDYDGFLLSPDDAVFDSRRDDNLLVLHRAFEPLSHKVTRFRTSLTRKWARTSITLVFYQGNVCCNLFTGNSLQHISPGCI